MPLPKEAFDITGGCNCGAIRYRIAVPEFSKRPLAFTLGPSPDPKDPKTVRLPHAAACHCNDCRSATGGQAMSYLILPADFMTVSAIPRGDADESIRSVTGRLVDRPQSIDAVTASDANRPPYVPSIDVLRPRVPGAEVTWLRFFHSYYCSSEVGSRAFCGRCGGPVAFHSKPQAEWFGPQYKQPEDFEHVIDVHLGTVDKHILDDGDKLAIEHDTSWKEGLRWYKKVLASGEGAAVRTKHPNSSLAEVVEDKEL
ncbi:hypothetical protein F5X68DRAFT_236945 [Plectosphaerella plurivora]|uniref:CENP-V/GFA domain-containing protein n=1 Tax=Plectosphaerella plurivora TaxID=936078 RepID=A0A9P8V2U5_9PEZI|nr:hypothetical protein F5X68DRAFT_236945 [Plectosphaerella plurivora]